MPSTSIIVIGGGGSPRSVDTDTAYHVDPGDAVENTATSLPAVHVEFTNDGTRAKTHLYLGPGEKISFTNAGTVVVPS